MANDDYDGGDDDYYGEEGMKVCRVYDSEDHFTAFVQFLLACFALASLYLKRQQETPRRKFNTWFLDVSKQGVGAVYAHILNMVIASIIAQNVRGEIQLKDECAWYAINYLIDTTLGLLLSIGFLALLDYVANRRDWVSLKHSGVYHGADGIWHWCHQLTAWLIVLTLVKVIICFFMWLTSPLLAFWGQVLFGPLQANIRFELLFVMIVFPGLLNVLYFWIIDSFLKAGKHHKHAHESSMEIPSIQVKDPKNEALIAEEGRASTGTLSTPKKDSKSAEEPSDTKEPRMGYVQPSPPEKTSQTTPQSDLFADNE